MSPIVIFGAELVCHGGREFDSCHLHTLGCERQGHPPGAYGELKRSTASGKLGQQVDGRAEHVGVEHQARGVVVTFGDVLAEMVLKHPPILASRRCAGHCIDRGIQGCPNRRGGPS
jgi:hypothetical protein